MNGVWLWHVFHRAYNLLTIECKGRKCPPPHQHRRRTPLCCSDKRGSAWPSAEDWRLDCEKHLSTYIGCETPALRTFQDRIQRAPEAWIRLCWNSSQKAAPVGPPKLAYRRRKEDERHDKHSGIQNVDLIVTLCEEFLLRVPCLLHYLLVQLIACF